ncbi:MAG: aspartate-semialdehyde dehydrogenase [Thermoleophilia bacterium]
MTRQYRVAVVGATGAVGHEMRSILAERRFPVSELIPLASAKSEGIELEFGESRVTCRTLTPQSFEGVDLALFSAGGSVSKEYAPIARDAGCVVIDNSSAWRMDKNVPLIVPEVNPQDAEGHRGIIANPNCSTIQMVVALKPLHDVASVKRVVVATYQAVSGTGTKAVAELIRQSDEVLEGVNTLIEVYPHQIAFNALPHIDVFLEDGSTKEEWKMVGETQKIMGDDSIRVTATCVRIPVMNGHSEAVNVELGCELTPDEARELLRNAPGICVMDNPQQLEYPMPVHASGTDCVYVGRIRRDPTVRYGLNLWVVADNLRKGAALNAVQIAELLHEQELIRVP